MFYKVIKDGKIIDVLDFLVFLKYQEKYNRMIFCDKEKAQAIFSSDRKYIWHLDSLYDVPVPGYDTVYIEEIDQYEYDRLKLLHCMTSEEIIDNTILCVLENNFNMGKFVDVLKRLYKNQAINDNQIIELFNNNKITEKEKIDILQK